MKMNLLLRKISEYDGFDLILGVFTTKKEAVDAKRIYIKTIKSSKEKDKYQEQSYREVDLEQDVVFEEIELNDSGSDSPELLVIVELAEGFGQLDLKIKGLFINMEKAKIYTNDLENSQKEDEWPCQYEIFSVEKNRLYISGVNNEDV